MYLKHDINAWVSNALILQVIMYMYKHIHKVLCFYNSHVKLCNSKIDSFIFDEKELNTFLKLTLINLTI